MKKKITTLIAEQIRMSDYYLGANGHRGTPIEELEIVISLIRGSKTSNVEGLAEKLKTLFQNAPGTIKLTQANRPPCYENEQCTCYLPGNPCWKRDLSEYLKA